MEGGDISMENGLQNGVVATKESEDNRKLFLGGLHSDASDTDVREYFSKFGEVEMSTVKSDIYTGKSRGFGFLVFKDVTAVKQVLNEPQHIIKDKVFEAKLATPQKSEQQNSKIFVGGVDKSTTKEVIEAAFTPQGKVLEVIIPIDKTSGESKGFAFVNFEDSSVAEQLCQLGKFSVDGKECDVKRANKQDRSFRGGRGGFRGGGGRGGYGGGRGGYGQQGTWGGPYGAGGYGQQSFPGQAYATQGYGSYQSGYGQPYNQTGYGQASYGQEFFGANAGGYGYDQNYQTAGYSEPQSWSK